MAKNNEVQVETASAVIPEHAVNPSLWARECAKLASDYVGMPESTVFLKMAQRFMTLDAAIQKLKDQVSSIPSQ